MKLKHIEVDGCIVNIRTGLSDMHGRRVTAVSIIPDQYAGEKQWRVFGCKNIRIVELKNNKKRRGK